MWASLINPGENPVKELADLGWEGPRDRYVLGTSSHVCSWKTVKTDGAEESVVICFLLLREKPGLGVTGKERREQEYKPRSLAAGVPVS